MSIGALPRRLIMAVRRSGLVLGLLLARQLGAQTLIYEDFSSTTGLDVNGHAAALSSGDGSVLRLVGEGGNQAGSAFATSLINVEDFSTRFQFRLTNPGGIDDGLEFGADGFTFVLQGLSSTAVGGSGAGMGYDGISPSVAVEFDLYFNGGIDPDLSSGGSNHVGLNTGGATASLATAATPAKLDDEALWTAWIDYDGSTLEVRLSLDGIRPESALLSHSLSITSALNSTTAFVGFTAGTGSAYANHDILNWVYSPEYIAGGITAVPEPGTYALLGAGGLLLIAARRFRRAR